MTEQELRAIVRDAIAHHGTSGAAVRSSAPVAAVQQHASHAMFTVPAGAETGGACVIEPTVACNHCGYCKSLGH
jgi:hypothetical protein